MSEQASGAVIGAGLEVIGGVGTQVWRAGDGPPLLFLHPGDGFNPFPALEVLARTHRVIAPSHPGFDGSELPDYFRSVDDLAYWYLDLMKQLDLRDALVMGVSFGAWIAAEIAIKSTARIRALVLADAIGARFAADPRQRDVADLFAIPSWEQSRILYHTPALQAQSFRDQPQQRLLEMARNFDSFALYGWAPTLHDPKLARRLRRIDVPTQIIWGAEDRVVSREYGRQWSVHIPGALFSVIPDAGHYAHLDQPDRFTETVCVFTRQVSSAHYLDGKRA